MLNISCALNNLSFGAVSFGIIYELYKRKIPINFFPIANNVDLSTFDKIDENFKKWIGESVFGAQKNYKKDNPTIKAWHINGAEEFQGNKNNLLTFFESDRLTETESNILNQQEHIFVTCQYTKDVFEKHEVIIPITVIPLGFDDLHYRKTNKKYYPDDRIAFGLAGKFENRKGTGKIINNWAKKFGNDKKYCLNLSVYNPFLNKEQNNQLIINALGGQRVWNINVLPYTNTLSEYNDVLNASHISLDMGTESWSLPSFTSNCLGKHSVLLDVAGIKEWASDSGGTLIQPCGKISIIDNIFFKPNEKFNTGEIFEWDKEEFIQGCETAIEKYKSNPVNEQGLALPEKFSWKIAVDKILEKIPSKLN